MRISCSVRRLRGGLTKGATGLNQAQPGSTGFNRVQPGSTRFNRVAQPSTFYLLPSTWMRIVVAKFCLTCQKFTSHLEEIQKLRAKRSKSKFWT